jgi:hypothetical protein
MYKRSRGDAVARPRGRDEVALARMAVADLGGVGRGVPRGVADGVRLPAFI